MQVTAIALDMGSMSENEMQYIVSQSKKDIILIFPAYDTNKYNYWHQNKAP